MKNKIKTKFISVLLFTWRALILNAYAPVNCKSVITHMEQWGVLLCIVQKNDGCIKIPFSEHSGRVLDLRLRGCGLEPYRGHCVQ